MKHPVRSWLAAGLLFLSFPVIAAEAVLVPPSTVSVTFKQMNVSVDATFNKFSGSIDFDPAKPAAGSAQFTIDITSFDLGSEEYNKEVLKPDWFDAAKYPTATFVSDSLKVVSPTQLEASGKLTIRGKAQEVHFPVSVKDAGKQRSFDGVIHINRTAFDVGTGEWKATDVVADEVIIKVHAVSNLKN
ncbi:MAG: YceI family protein [Burkholderiaceae bacterium]|jgi:polyisoprenoid-binding protein YceI